MPPFAPLIALLLSASPVPSFEQLPVSNGVGAAVVDAADGGVRALWIHPYAAPSAGAVTPDVCAAVYLGVSADGEPGVWLGETKPESVGYVDESGVVRTAYRHDGLEIEVFAFAPWELSRAAIVQFARVTNPSTSFDDRAVTIAALADCHVGAGVPEPSGQAERIELAGPSTWLETGQETDHVMVYRGFPHAHRAVATPDGPYAPFLATGQLPPPTSGGDVIVPIDADDIVVAMSRGPATLAPGATAVFGFVAAYGEAGAESALQADIIAYLAGRDPEPVLASELSAWEVWLGTAPLLGAAGDVGRAARRHSLALLRMGQVRQVGAAPHGQLLASLPPGSRNATWPRDTAYGAVALAQLGYTDAAWDALAFVLGGSAGTHAAELGGDYLVSVGHYAGDGQEVVPSDPAPRIALDGMGLLLWALSEWADAADDASALEARWADVKSRVVDVLLGLVDDDGLLPADAGLYERGEPRQHTFTNLAAAAGLCGASRLAARFGEAELATTYADAAVALRDAVLTHLVDAGTSALTGLRDTFAGDGGMDTAVVEAINWGLVAPDASTAMATLTALETLRVAPDRGFRRSDAQDPEDLAESVFATLRIAAAQRAMGDEAAADAVIAWVVAQGGANYGLVAERYDAASAAYNGSTPSLGLGAGALLLVDRDVAVMGPAGCLPYEPPPAPEVGPEPTADAAPEAPGADAGPARPPFTPIPLLDGDDDGCGAARARSGRGLASLALLSAAGLWCWFAAYRRRSRRC